jgi:hypothetical protein
MSETPWWKASNPRPPVPTSEQSAAMAAGVGVVLQVIAEAMVNVYESADGVRAQLRRRGYSEEAAENAAMQHIMLAQQALWQGASQ